MRRFFYYIFILIAVTELSTVMTSCRRSRTVAALVEADSLMWTRPDSSLALVQSVSPDTLDDENRAYHALLLTQAQFRNNIYPDTDTIINRALDFYADNHNRERLTRSLIYKGFVYEINSRPSDAMDWYLKAEDNVGADDYRNLCNIYLRKAVLYRDYFANYNEDIYSFKKALNIYKLLNDSTFQLFCLGNIGGLYRKTNIDSAKFYLREAIDMAYSLGDSSKYYIDCEYLIRLNIMNGEYDKAKKLLLEKISSKSAYLNNDYYYDLSMIYAKTNNVDSAELILSFASKPVNNPELDAKLKVEIAIAEARGDFKKASEIGEKEKLFAKKLTNNNVKTALYDKENKHITNINLSLKGKNKQRTYIGIILILSLIFVSAILVYFKFKKEKELQNKSDKSQLDLIKAFVNSAKAGININEDVFDDEFWISLKSYLNNTQNNIINKIEAKHSPLPEKELRFIELICLNLNSAEIAFCLGYSRASSVRTLKVRLRDKFRIDSSVEDYIEQLKNT